MGHGLSPDGPVNGRRMARRRETAREDGALWDLESLALHLHIQALSLHGSVPAGESAFRTTETREEGKRCSSSPCPRASYKGPCPPHRRVSVLVAVIDHLTSTPRIPTTQSFHPPTDHHHVCPQRALPLQNSPVNPSPTLGHVALRLLLPLQHLPRRLLRALCDLRQDAAPRAQQRRSRRVLVLQRVGMFLPRPRGWVFVC